MASDHQWEDWLGAILTTGVNLTAWEETFVKDLAHQLRRCGRLALSEKQANQLERIYAERTP